MHCANGRAITKEHQVSGIFVLCDSCLKRSGTALQVTSRGEFDTESQAEEKRQWKRISMVVIFSTVVLASTSIIIIIIIFIKMFYYIEDQGTRFNYPQY